MNRLHLYDQSQAWLCSVFAPRFHRVVLWKLAKRCLHVMCAVALNCVWEINIVSVLQEYRWFPSAGVRCSVLERTIKSIAKWHECSRSTCRHERRPAPTFTPEHTASYTHARTLAQSCTSHSTGVRKQFTANFISFHWKAVLWPAPVSVNDVT